MELFDKLKKSDKNNDVKVNGWDAITNLCDKIYPNQKNPKHYGTLISWEMIHSKV